MNNLYLGIDTSNYTTSIAIFDANCNLIVDERTTLVVKKGNRGLRQSEAFFQHNQNLPKLLKKAAQKCNLKNDLHGIVYSKSPRPQENSYMPVFTAGKNLAEILGLSLNIPLYGISHQENHIEAAVYGSAITINNLSDPFYAVHFSGGTSEILQVNKDIFGYKCKIISKTLDLNAGQLIDRIGVLLDFTFPCGKQVEIMAQTSKTPPIIKPVFKNLDFHLSGHENIAVKLIENNISKEDVCSGVLHSIAQTLIKALDGCIEKYGIGDIVFSGGVMSNKLIKQEVERCFIKKKCGIYFSKPEFASDNAVGNAHILSRKEKKAEDD